MIFKTLAESHYRLADAEHGIEYDVDRLRRDRGELVGELAVSCGLAGARVIDDGVLRVGTFNFSSPRARQEHAKRLAERARTNGKVDWHGQLEELCQRVIKAERTGTPAIVLRTLPRPAADVDYDVDGFGFPQQHSTIRSATAARVKACSTCMSSAGSRNAGCAWRCSIGSWTRRSIGCGSNPCSALECPMFATSAVTGRSSTKSIACNASSSTNSWTSSCTTRPASPATGSRRTQNRRSATSAPCRQIGGGSLHIAHINKSENNEHKPFGSSFWHNSARSTWFVKLAATSKDGTVSTIGLFHRKANLGPRRPALGYAVTFADAQTRIERVDVASVDELVTSLPLWQRMKDALKDGPQTLASLAADLDAPVDSIDKAVRRKSNLFTKVSHFDDHITRIALVENRRAS